MIRSFIICLIVVISSVTVNAQNEPVKITDMLKIKTIGSITSTADGSRTAFVVQSIIPDPASKLDYKYQTQIYMLSPGSEPVQLTFGNESSSQPAWSPDGKQLAFVRTADQRAQIFILNMSGGEAWQLTRLTSGASNPRWSPDGKKILFTSGLSFKNLLSDSTLNPEFTLPEWPSERPGFVQNENLKKNTSKGDPDGSIKEIRAYLENNVADKKAVVVNKLNFQDESNISTEQSFSQLYIIDVNRDAQPKKLTKGFYRYSSGSFTPDGNSLVFSANLDSTRHPDRSLETAIFLMDLNTGAIKKLAGKKDWSYSGMSLSPSGKWIAFQSSPVAGVDIPELNIMSVNGNETITIKFDRNKSNFTWTSDERFLYFTSPSNGGTPLYRANISTRQVEQLSSYDKGITSFSLSPGRIIYSQTAVENPSAIFVADELMKSPKQAGEFNAWVKSKKLSYPEKHTFTNEKGMTVEYWVMKPSNYRNGEKYPLLLEIHGGPSAMWGPGEASMWHEYQFFCSKGYGVVYSNPRGSGGYGEEFLRANIADWGKGPMSDVLTALDRTVAEGWADTSKLLITGGSYAGYLTAYIIAHDHRFKAACAQRGVYDLSTFFGEGNAWRLVPDYFGGYPWEPKVHDLLVKESPITYVNQITTPLIIFHGDNDRRTGFVGSEMLYRSLKVLNRPVEYVRHPNATHEITRSGDNRQRIDQMLRTYEFFERWIKH